MKHYRFTSKLLALAFIVFSILPSVSLATSWSYPIVVYEGHIYEVTDKTVTEIDKEIGKVTSYSDMEPLPGNFSNEYEEGTKYYSIKGADTDDTIAVETANGEYKEAVKKGKYTASTDEKEDNTLYIVLGVVAVIVIILVLILLRRNKRR